MTSHTEEPSQPATFCVSYVLTLADLDALSTLVEKENTGWLDTLVRWLWPVLACFGAVSSLVNFWSGSANYNSWMGRYGDVIFWVSLALFVPIVTALRPFLFRMDSRFDFEEQVCLEEDGVRTHSLEEGFLVWDDIWRVEEVEAHCFLFLDEKHALIVPKRAFDSPQTAQNFIAFAHHRWREAHPVLVAPPQ